MSQSRMLVFCLLLLKHCHAFMEHRRSPHGVGQKVLACCPALTHRPLSPNITCGRRPAAAAYTSPVAAATAASQPAAAAAASPTVTAAADYTRHACTAGQQVHRPGDDGCVPQSAAQGLATTGPRSTHTV